MRPVPLLTVLLSAAVAAASEPAPPAALELPYVYTSWKQFTTADGLPDDHVFAVKANGNDVWVGTEGGLALIDKRQGKVVKVWREADGLPFRAIAALDVNPVTGDVWIGMFGGGLARLSGGRFEHWHQLNSGLVNDVVYGVAVEHDNVWCATTAGASRFNTTTGEWAIFNEKNAPMEEIWNYAVSYSAAEGKVYLAVWGSGVLEYTLATGRWKEYLDPDGEMEIDLFRDDGINHVIVTGVAPVDGVLWVSSYFGGSRYDGRSWRGLALGDGGIPSLFNNNVRGRSADEAWYCTDKGVGVIADVATDTWVKYTRLAEDRGRVVVTRGGVVVEEIVGPVTTPHSFIVNADLDGHDVWVATSHGLGWAIGDGYYPGLRARPLIGTAPTTPAAAAAATVAEVTP